MANPTYRIWSMSCSKSLGGSVYQTMGAVTTVAVLWMGSYFWYLFGIQLVVRNFGTTADDLPNFIRFFTVILDISITCRGRLIVAEKGLQAALEHHFLAKTAIVLIPKDVRRFPRKTRLKNASHIVSYPNHLTPVPIRLGGVAHLKRPAGTADWWGHASHQGICAPRDATGTLGVP
ncbi:hypothetical protein P692DRAFT_201810728 [Suillus brevipes Sb2]|nr:hypothetical protein P692DRAFT_201810728 [Suillus brevipes Sb2]